MTRSVAMDQTNVSALVRMITAADGTPATGVTSATAGLEIWYQRDKETLQTEISGISNLATLDAAHTDWGLLHIENGYYRVDYPDAAFVKDAGGVTCGMKATGIDCVADYILIDPLIKFSGSPSSVTATTTTFASPGPPVYQGDYIYVIQGTGIGQTRMIKSMSGLQATHDAWDVNISDSTSTIIVIPGDETVATAAVRTDVAVSSRSVLDESGVNTQVDIALADIGLQYLVSAAVSGADITDDSIIAKIVSANSAADWDTYNNITDSLESIASNAVTSAEIAALNDITAADVWSELLGTTGESASAILQVIASAVSGKLSGAATSTITIRNIQDTADVITATVDADGNRSAVSITYPAD